LEFDSKNNQNQQYSRHPDVRMRNAGQRLRKGRAIDFNKSSIANPPSNKSKGVLPGIIDQSKNNDPKEKAKKKKSTSNELLDLDNMLADPLPIPKEEEVHTVEFGVGKGGQNYQADVHLVQQYLWQIGLLMDDEYDNEITAPTIDDTTQIKESSLPLTIKAITKFQREVLHWQKYDGNISGPDSKTLKQLKTATASFVEERLEKYPEIAAERRVKAKADEEQKRKVEAKREKEAEEQRKNEAKIKKLKETKTDKDSLQKINNKHGGDISCIAEELREFAPYNPELVKKMLNSMDYSDQDDLAYEIVLHESNLSRYSKDLLTKLKSELIEGWTGDEEYEQVKRINSVLGDESPVDVKLIELMKKDRLSPKEISEVRDLILNTEGEIRKEYFLKLQYKTKYENQRDSKVTDKGERVEKAIGGICNLTALAMALQYLGISNPKPEMQYEDALEKIRQENNFASRTGAGWEQVAKKLGAEVTFIINRGNTSPKDQQWYISNVLNKLQEGYSIIFSIKGHIARIQDVTNKGLVVDDPYGRLDLGKRFNNKFRGGYEKYNKSEWNWRNEGEYNEGEDNIWSWKDVKKYPMWWVAAVKK